MKHKATKKKSHYHLIKTSAGFIKMAFDTGIFLCVAPQKHYMEHIFIILSSWMSAHNNVMKSNIKKIILNYKALKRSFSTTSDVTYYNGKDHYALSGVRKFTIVCGI